MHAWNSLNNHLYQSAITTKENKIFRIHTNTQTHTHTQAPNSHKVWRECSLQKATIRSNEFECLSLSLQFLECHFSLRISHSVIQNKRTAMIYYSCSGISFHFWSEIKKLKQSRRYLQSVSLHPRCDSLESVSWCWKERASVGNGDKISKGISSEKKNSTIKDSKVVKQIHWDNMRLRRKKKATQSKSSEKFQ